MTEIYVSVGKYKIRFEIVAGIFLIPSATYNYRIVLWLSHPRRDCSEHRKELIFEVAVKIYLIGKKSCLWLSRACGKDNTDVLLLIADSCGEVSMNICNAALCLL